MREKNLQFSVLQRLFTKMVLPFLALFLCASFSGNVITDARGEVQSQIQIPDTPQRIVVLPLLAEEMLFEMIEPDRIVGVGHEYLENGEAYSPTMELTKHLRNGLWIYDVEEILDLEPDLVVLWKGDSRDVDYSDYETLLLKLEQAGIAVLLLDVPESFSDIMSTVVTLGEAVGAPEKADRMVLDMKATLAQITEIVSRIPEEKRVRATYYEPASPECFRVNDFHIIARAAGVTMASGSDTDYMEMNEELLVAWNPDLIIVSPIEYDGPEVYDIGSDYEEQAIARVLNNPRLSHVKAVQNGNVHPLPIYNSQYVVQSIMALAQLAYPDLFLEKEE